MRRNRLFTTSLIMLLTMAVLLPARAQTDPPATEEPAEPAEAVEAVEPEPEPGPDFTEVNDLLQEGSYAEASELLSAMGEEFPEDAGLLLMHGEVLLALRKTDEALEKLRKCAELDPGRPRVHFQIGSALSASGEIDEAFEQFGLELENNDNVRVLTFARLNRSMLLGRKKDWIGAAGELEEALRLDPTQVQMYGDLITLYLQADDLEKTGSALERGAEAGFVSAPHYYSFGARLYKAERDDEAVAAFGQALAVDPQLSRAELSIAAALERLGRNEEAVAHLERYLEISPDAPDAGQVAEKIKQAKSS